MLVSFYQWLKGYLIIQIIGYSPERFLNLCKNKNIHVWKITPDNNTYRIRILLKNLYELKTISKKTGVKIKIIKRCGFPFLLNRLKKRKIFSLGLIICIMFILTTRNFIWEIKVSGNHMITEDVVLSFLEEQDIKTGVWKKKINCSQLVTQMRDEFDSIVWTSFSINGTNLCISVKEKNDITYDEPQQEINQEMKAKCAGVVVKMITRTGTPVVTVGDIVNIGDVLVVGDADIWIETVMPYADEILATYSYKNYDDDIKYAISYIGDNCIIELPRKMQLDSMTEILSESKRGITIKKYRTYDWSFDAYSEKERENLLRDKLESYCNNLENNNAEIKERNINITHYINKSISSGTIRLIYLHRIW